MNNNTIKCNTAINSMDESQESVQAQVMNATQVSGPSQQYKLQWHKCVTMTAPSSSMTQGIWT